jgi:hypothetical protein
MRENGGSYIMMEIQCDTTLQMATWQHVQIAQSMLHGHHHHHHHISRYPCAVMPAWHRASTLMHTATYSPLQSRVLNVHNLPMLLCKDTEFLQRDRCQIAQ